ncbi:LLM class flavin-dependent oxidoreductase [Sphingobium fuliginis]|uniref:LLM class flavin-dependent oxidoreductase n=1 Tax=Sphingobium fuliginis ATCC 27551 TaxID=1208342 RepID=A0A5B8CI44_SPHSA|nr:LLM class flavin-dependent oxidoreductase [Sphingobium fuliginis]QDC37767.1 LLM class flavin-dependent oxidoreductase [Sphingobium fuliginis ATCC 27551]
MSLTISCGFNGALDSHEHAAIADQLGFKRAFFYDTPAIAADVWIQLARAAERTSRIMLGPGVMVPSLRHPMVTANAIATLSSIAGQDRVIVAVGAGFTGRITMGQRPMKWQMVEEYLQALQALLRGEEVMWEGALMKMMHHDAWAPPRPIKIPFLVAAEGPKGIAAAKKYADGVIKVDGVLDDFDWNATIMSGTVLDDGEPLTTDHALRAGGPMAAVAMHMLLEFQDPTTLPNGVAWKAAYDAIPAERRHMAIHDGHAAIVNEVDRNFLTPEVLGLYGNAMDRVGWKEKLAEYEERGVTELIFQPVDDVPRELDAFMNMVMS